MNNRRYWKIRRYWVGDLGPSLVMILFVKIELNFLSCGIYHNVTLYVEDSFSIFSLKISENIPLLPYRKDLIPQKHEGGEKTTRLSKTTEPIRFLDSSNCAQISSQ
jgi:hypothetical protein